MHIQPSEQELAERQAAAIKIQALERGRQVRSLEARRAAEAAENSRKQQERESAAIKLQSIQRGRAERKRFFHTVKKPYPLHDNA